MRIRDVVAAAVIAGFGAFLIREGADLGLGEPTEPGSGFILWWIGIALLVAATALGAFGILAPAERPAAHSGSDTNLRLPLAGVGALVGYALLLQPLGFIPTSALLLSGLFAFIGGYRLPLSIALGSAAALASWFIFARLLASNLPAGILAGTPLGG